MKKGKQQTTKYKEDPQITSDQNTLSQPLNRCPRLRLVGVGDIGKSESGTPILATFWGG
ncbi:MAG: hypothetical protein K2O61_02755 [Bacteroidaceae bacterium]|nr:hypothetical protein [Bacteroidaceae bacterium]